jgi:hypothetical protein
MKTADRFINAFDSIFLLLIMGWSLAIVGALVHPAVQADRHTGAVEVYSLVNAQWLASSDAGQRSAT